MCFIFFIFFLEIFMFFFFFSSRRRHTRCGRDWSSDVCSSDLRYKVVALPPMMVPRINTSLPVPTNARAAQVRRLRVCTWINIVNFRQPDAGGHYLSLEEDSVSPGRKSNQNRSVEIIRRANPVARIYACCVSFQLSLAAMSAPVWIEQVKGQTG